MRIFSLIAGICIAILAQVGISYATNSYCSWETSSNSKRYNFNLLTSSGHPHGARSEDGFYTIVDKSQDGTETTYWFQLCDHMQFNYNAPKCDQCEACGGPSHCGETCSALQSTSDGGYAHCTTLGAASNLSYSLIESAKPETGLAVKMVATGLGKSCSLTVSIYCNTKSQELPTTITKNVEGNCDYATNFEHSAGCPIVTNMSRGGMGWFATFVIVLLCLFVVYLAVGIGYRVSVLGVSGLEAIPNLDFWKSLPYTIKFSKNNEGDLIDLDFTYDSGLRLFMVFCAYKDLRKWWFFTVQSVFFYNFSYLVDQFFLAFWLNVTAYRLQVFRYENI